MVETTNVTQKSTKLYVDQRQKEFNFDEGQLVWLYNLKSRRGVPHRLDANKWSGPWVVAKKISPCVYLILGRPGDRAGRVVDVERLQPYVPRPDRLIPTEPNNDNLNDQLVDEHESNSDSEQYSDTSVLLLVNPMAMENADDEL